jgi:hypothetical protein
MDRKHRAPDASDRSINAADDFPRIPRYSGAKGRDQILRTRRPELMRSVRLFRYLESIKKLPWQVQLKSAASCPAQRIV